ncbi:MAG: hypothetical protein Q9210_007298 [Variospora velana]
MASGTGRVLLAYSGGLDTSVILAWLIERGYEVICFIADVGQEEDFEAAKAKAVQVGARKCIVQDLKKEFVESQCWPAIMCNAHYENVYYLGTSLARPVIARAQVQMAQQEGCSAVSHGCTGKGNDGVRFQFAYAALDPDMEVIVPWRDPKFFNTFAGRQELLDYAAKKGISVSSTKAKPWSMDENLAHCSYESGLLEDPDTTPPTDMWKLVVDPEKASDQPERFIVQFAKGIPVKLEYTENGNPKSVTEPVELLTAANALARRNGVGRVDIVENRYVGIKSRGCYETPGLTCLRKAHIDLEGLCLDREVRAFRDQSVTIEYGRLLYNGLYFSPEREALQSYIAKSQENVNGRVRVKLYKGNAIIEGRTSDSSLYDMSESSMDELGGFLPTDSTGFVCHTPDFQKAEK